MWSGFSSEIETSAPSKEQQLLGRMWSGFSSEIEMKSPLEKKVMKQKLKTHTAMAKRVRVTGSGKFMRRKVAASHHRRNKSPEAVRSMDKDFPLAKSDTRRMKRLLPYAF
jgi:large subunit ribosomal protein L35